MEPSTDLRDLTVQVVQAVGDGDVAFLERHISRQADVAFLGTDPDEWWTDLASLSRALTAQRQAGVTAISGDPLAYQEGNVGWAVDRRVRVLIGDHEVPFRFSVVYRREDGAWKMVHFHSSIGVPSEDAIGVELPT
jgi:hypothetical protein